MTFLDEHQAECLRGGARGRAQRQRAGSMPVAGILRGSLGGSSVLTTTASQINLAFNIVLNGGSIVNTQLNGLDLSVIA